MRSLLKKLGAWRNAILGTSLVLMGMVAATVTVLARRTEDAELASAAAIASLVIAALLTIFVVPPLARSARSEFGRVDMPFEVTKGGLVFLSVLGVVAFAAWNTGNNLLFLVFSLLLSTIFVAWAAARTSLRDMVVKARFPDHIFAGEPAPVIVTLRNAKRFFPSFSVLVEARGPDGVKQSPRRRKRKRIRFSKRALAYFIYVPHRAAAEQRVEQLFERRGHVLITGFEISTRFPFGFFRRRRRLRARNVDLIVYPKPEPISDELHLLPLNAGQHLSLRRGAGFDLFSLRDYQPQDDLRHIDWKATARSRRLTVREFTAEDERRITIALDTRTPRADKNGREVNERFEKSVNYAASLVAHFITERVEVRLALGSEMGRYGTGQEHLYRCLRRLALVVPTVDDEEARAESAIESPQADENQPELHIADGNFSVLLTTAAPGSIPANVWRSSYVKYF